MVTECVSRSETGAEFVARVKGLYGQPSVPSRECNNRLPNKAWNRSEPTSDITVAIIERNQVHKEERVIMSVDCPAATLSEVSTLQDRVELSSETSYPEMERAYDELTEDWNLQNMFSYMDSEEEEFCSGDEDGILIKDEKLERVTLLKEEQAQKIEVQKEPRTSQSMNIQDEECSHTKWESTNDLLDGNYLTARQMGISTECLIEPDCQVAEGSTNNNYVGTEWIMVNGLKVIVKQGDLVDVEVEVIVNPANSELCHGGRAARAISVAAGKELDDECSEYIRQFGKIKVGNGRQFTTSNKTCDSCCRAKGARKWQQTRQY